MYNLKDSKSYIAKYDDKLVLIHINKDKIAYGGLVEDKESAHLELRKSWAESRFNNTTLEWLKSNREGMSLYTHHYLLHNFGALSSIKINLPTLPTFYELTLEAPLTISAGFLSDNTVVGELTHQE